MLNRPTSHVFALFVIVVPLCQRVLAAPEVSPEDPDKLLNRAIENQRAGNFQVAKSLCRQILDEFPHYVDARNIYARVLSFESNYKESLIQYDSALAYEKTNEDARFGKAQVLAWMEKYPESLSFLRSLVQEKPGNQDYVTEMAKVELWSGDEERSYADFKKAYALDTTSLDVIRWTARAASKSNRKLDATMWYRRVVAKIPYDVEAQSEINRLAYSAKTQVQLQYSAESFGPPLDQNHRILSLEYYRELSEAWKPYGRVARFLKFGKTEIQVGGGVYGRLSFGNSMFAQLLVSPAAEVIPRWDLSLEFSEALGNRVEGAAGLRFLSFAGTQVLVLSPGATVYIVEHVSVTTKLYLARTSNGASSFALIGSVVYRVAPRTTLRLAGFAGDETFRATTVDEIVAFQSRGIQAGAKIRINENYGLDGIYQYTARSSQAKSHFFGLTLLFYF